jgi:hypothetical protein
VGGSNTGNNNGGFAGFSPGTLTYGSAPSGGGGSSPAFGGFRFETDDDASTPAATSTSNNPFAGFFSGGGNSGGGGGGGGTPATSPGSSNLRKNKLSYIRKRNIRKDQPNTTEQYILIGGSRCMVAVIDAASML